MELIKSSLKSSHRPPNPCVCGGGDAIASEHSGVVAHCTRPQKYLSQEAYSISNIEGSVKRGESKMYSYMPYLGTPKIPVLRRSPPTGYPKYSLGIMANTLALSEVATAIFYFSRLVLNISLRRSTTSFNEKA